LALLLLIFMLSLAGIPPTAGFMAKYFIFPGADRIASPRCWRFFAGAVYRARAVLLFPRGRACLDEEAGRGAGAAHEQRTSRGAGRGPVRNARGGNLS